MYAWKLSSEWKLKERIQKLKTMMLPTAVFVPKRPTNEDEMLAAVHKYVYEQYRNSGELARLEERSNDIDRRTGNYSTDFYSQRKVLGNPSSNLKPYIEPEAVNFAVDFFTEDFRTLADRDASFGEKLEAGFFIIFRPAKAAKKVAKTGDEVSDARKNVSKGIDKANPEKVINALSNFQSKKMTFGNQQFLLDKKGMKHILERHHPEYWNGTVKKSQSFLDKNLSVDDVANIAQSVMKQNRTTLINRGTTSSYQISGTVNGVEYVVGLNKGRIGQLYSK